VRRMEQRIEEEFWAFLCTQGFPSGINEKVIFARDAEIRRILYVKPPKCSREWAWIHGGEHSDDVALVSVLAEKLGLKQGKDWDWWEEEDGYHLSIGFSNTPEVQKLLRLLNIYNEARIIRFDAEIFGEFESEEELQKFFQQRWKRLKEEKKRLMKQLEEQLEKSKRWWSHL